MRKSKNFDTTQKLQSSWLSFFWPCVWMMQPLFSLSPLLRCWLECAPEKAAAKKNVIWRNSVGLSASSRWGFVLSWHNINYEGIEVQPGGVSNCVSVWKHLSESCAHCEVIRCSAKMNNPSLLWGWPQFLFLIPRRGFGRRRGATVSAWRWRKADKHTKQHQKLLFLFYFVFPSLYAPCISVGRKWEGESWVRSKCGTEGRRNKTIRTTNKLFFFLFQQNRRVFFYSFNLKKKRTWSDK